MLKFLRMIMLMVICAGFMTACSGSGSGGAPAGGTVETDATTNQTKTELVLSPAGAKITIPAGTSFSDSAGAPLTGKLTVQATYSNSPTGVTPLLGTTLVAYVNITIKDASGKTAATVTPTPPGVFTAVLDAAGMPDGSIPAYSSNDSGATWTFEADAPVAAGKATVTITHLSYWGIFKKSVSPVTTTSKSVSGTVSDGILPVADSLVTITAFDANGNKTDSILFSTGAVGAFSNSLKMADSGGYVVITVAKEGYTEYSKRIPFDAGSDITLSATLDALPAPQVAIPSDTVPMKAAASIKAFTFGVFKNADGTQRLLAGPKLKAAKAAGATADLELTIPQASVPGVNRLVGAMKSYDSSNPSDAAKFPGDYIDNKGNKLISLAFDSINITDENGKGIGEVVQKAMAAGKISKAALDANPTIMNKHIPGGSCEMLLNDFCTGAAGDDALCKKLPAKDDVLYGKTIAFSWVDAFNVPIYSYDSYNGSWELIGIGTIDSNNDGDITSADNTDKTGTDGKPDVPLYKAACTASSGMYLKILVTSEKYKRSWWNLDYPLLFDAPKEVCISGTFKDSTGEKLTGWLNLYSRITNNGYATADKDGKFTIKTALLDKDNVQRGATLQYYDEFSNAYKSEEIALGDWDSATKTCGKTKDIVIVRPKRCEVAGTIVNEGATADTAGTPKADTWLWIYGQDPYFSKSELTTAAGAFSSKVACDQPLNIYFGGSSLKQFTATDSAKATDLGTIIVKNQPPQVSGFFNSGAGIIVGGTSKITFNAYDPDGNYPLAWKVEVKSGADVAKTYNSTAANQFTYSSSKSLEITGLAEGSYDVVITVTDKSSKSGSYTLPRKLDVASQNRAPGIARYAATLVTGKGITMEAAATDLETAPANLKYSWKVKDSTGKELLSAATATAFYPVAADTADNTVFTVELTVSDDGSYFDGNATKTDAAKIKTVGRTSTVTYTKVRYNGTITVE